MPDNIEHRRPTYSFTTRAALVDYFARFLSKTTIVKVYNDCKTNFHVREGTSRRDRRLQLLKKCEFRLVRRLNQSPE